MKCPRRRFLIRSENVLSVCLVALARDSGTATLLGRPSFLSVPASRHRSGGESRHFQSDHLPQPMVPLIARQAAGATVLNPATCEAAYCVACSPTVPFSSSEKEEWRVRAIVVGHG